MVQPRGRRESVGEPPQRAFGHRGGSGPVLKNPADPGRARGGILRRNEDRFAVPDDILYRDGNIRDYSNDVEIVGTDELWIRADDGYSRTDEVECVELWEERRA